VDKLLSNETAPLKREFNTEGKANLFRDDDGIYFHFTRM
jgi:hypothetical protein